MTIQGFKSPGSEYYDILRQKESALAIQNKILDELEKVQNKVNEHLSKPKENDKIVFSKIQKVFPSDKEITYSSKFKPVPHSI